MAVGALSERLLEVLSRTDLEHYHGLASFDWRWLLGLSLWPALGGVVCGLVIGAHGKWWAPLSPLLVRSVLWSAAATSAAVRGLDVVPLGIWGFELLLCADAAWVGGFLGERLRRQARPAAPPTA